MSNKTYQKALVATEEQSAPDGELLSCPFCGGRAEIKKGGYTKYVMCLNCEVMGSNLTNEQELIAQWNTRAAQQKPDGWQPIETAPPSKPQLLK